MATPNYGYEKRQKELAKKRKKEEKLREKADRKAGLLPPAQDTGEEAGSATPAAPAPHGPQAD